LKIASLKGRDLGSIGTFSGPKRLGKTGVRRKP